VINEKAAHVLSVSVFAKPKKSLKYASRSRNGKQALSSVHRPNRKFK
jgi:hypothetical protein